MLNLALRKPALQSSVSQYSIGRTPTEDARGGNNGHISRPYGFHTGTERDPWWQVDLEDSFLVRRLVIFNRPEQAQRLNRFTVLGSHDGKDWKELFRKADDVVFGRNGEPFVAEIADSHPARFVRVRLDGEEPLHFVECQVFGEHPDPKTRARMEEEAFQAAQRRNYIPEGRSGRVVEIGGIAIFVDERNYEKSIVESLDRGDYESTERHLVFHTVTHADRIIDIGTGTGVVAMTAARIAGADRVMTFEANPDLARDARENFMRNGLDGIRSYVGILRNRKAITDPNERVPFHIHKAFWASRLSASASDTGIVQTVQLPIFCLEDAIAEHRATVLISDIEGAEAELLKDADLSAIRLIIMEIHYWAVGEVAIDEMVRQLILGGLSIHLGLSQPGCIVFRRHTSQ